MRNGLAAIALLSTVGLTACTEGTRAPQASGQVYSSSEGMRAMQTAGCRVGSSRYVTMIGDSQADRDRNSINQGVGIIAGALIGKAIGDEFGGSLAQNLGALGGAVVGSNVADNVNAQRTTRTGVEYRVISGGQERVIVQPLNNGEQVLASGSACRITGDSARVRVQPA